MQELDRILHDLDQGNINIPDAKKQIMELDKPLFNDLQNDCPNCGISLKIEVREMTNSDIIKALQRNNSKT
jgi:hypothetical protein